MSKEARFGKHSLSVRWRVCWIKTFIQDRTILIIGRYIFRVILDADAIEFEVFGV